MINGSGGSQGKKKALIIAISEYDNLPKERQLPFCRNDGDEIYKLLQNEGYEILDDWKLIGRVTSDQIYKAIFDFFRRQSEPKDTLLFYFSGHGIPDGYGDHYLATTDINPDYPDDLGFSFKLLETRIRTSVAKRIITILDCCFSGAAGITMGSEDDIAKSARSAIERTFEEGDGKCVLASSMADQVSYKMRGQEYSLFTYCLLEGLKGGKEAEAVNREGYVTSYTLGNYVYHRIMSIDRRQRPVTKTVTAGDIILAHPKLVEIPEKEVSPSPTPAPTPRGSVNLEQTNSYLNFLLDSARQYYTHRNYGKAIVFFDKVLEMNPGHIEAMNSKGISLYRLGEYNEARNCFDKVLEIDPGNIVALNNVEILKEKITTTDGEPTLPQEETAAKKLRQEEKQQLLELLRKGNVKQFNAMRQERNKSSPDLSNANLSGAKLKDANLSCADLSGANLESANLWATNFNSANLEGAKLQKAYLCYADLTNAKLKTSRLMEADLSGANLNSANLEGANLWKANLKKSNLSGAKLKDANLEGANLNRANLESANLWATNFNSANLEGANLSTAFLLGTRLLAAKLSDARIHSSILIGVSYQVNNLICARADFIDAIIDDENLSSKLYDRYAKNVPHAAKNKKDLRKKLETRGLLSNVIDECLLASSLPE